MDPLSVAQLSSPQQNLVRLNWLLPDTGEEQNEEEEEEEDEDEEVQ